jgi:hypothetical protein
LIELGTSAATDATAAGVDEDPDEGAELVVEVVLEDELPAGGVALAFALLLVVLLLPHPARAITPTSGIKIIQLRIQFLLKLCRVAQHKEKRADPRTF